MRFDSADGTPFTKGFTPNLISVVVRQISKALVFPWYGLVLRSHHGTGDSINSEQANEVEHLGFTRELSMRGLRSIMFRIFLGIGLPYRLSFALRRSASSKNSAHRLRPPSSRRLLHRIPTLGVVTGVPLSLIPSASLISSSVPSFSINHDTLWSAELDGPRDQAYGLASDPDDDADINDDVFDWNEKFQVSKPVW